ncbi:MAG: PQQ-like beta-propeller repeat protein, partial [Archaeoglobaceae archaeon]|nr:PQQ-like beta-propeller repeat protein [Archaeoglobaceae archaeon]
MRWFLILAITLLFLYCVQEAPEIPTTPETPVKTPETPTPPKERVLKEITPLRKAEKVPENYLPLLKSWTHARGTERGDLYTLEIPRKPEILDILNVSAYLKNEVATPIAEDYVFIFDNYKVYAYDNELLWTFNVFESFEKEIRAYAIGKYLYVGTTSGKKGFSLIAFEKESGKIAWHSEINVAGSISALTVNEYVCIGTDYLDPWVMCFSENGELKWRAKVAGSVNGFAIGNGKLFVSANKLYAFDLKSGKLLWELEKGYSSPVYKNGLIFVSKQGYVYAFSERGEELWKKYFGTGEDLNYNPLLSVSNDTVYIPRIIGKEPFDLQVVDFNGNILGTFNLTRNEIPGAPVVSDDIVILPVKGENYEKIYILWRGLEKLFEIEHKGVGVS